MPENEQTLAAAVGLQTAAINALVVELRAARAEERPSLHALWHTAVATVVAVSCFAGLWLLLPDGMVVIK